MKISYRKVAFWAIVVVVLVFVFTNPQVGKSEISYKVETIDRFCSFEQAVPEMDIRAVEDSIIITVPFNTPTPCNDVEGQIKIERKEIKVDLNVKEQKGFCTQCLGIVVGRVTISGLDKGTWGVQLKTPERALITSIMIQ